MERINDCTNNSYDWVGEAVFHIEDPDFDEYNVQNPDMLTGETVSAM